MVWAFRSLSNLARLDLSYNRLAGEIPRELGALKSLEALGLHHNNLSGAIPWELSRIGTLKRLILNGNRLSGSVPPEFAKMDGLTHLNVADNPLARGIDDGTKDIKAIDTKRGDAIGGVDALDETTHIIDDPHTRQFIETAMSAVGVREGFLHLDIEALPKGVDSGRFQRAIHTVNERLHQAGERIESVGDLERALEVYGKRSVAVPEASSGASFTSGGGGQTRQSAGLAIIDCPDFKADYSHSSVTTPGKITGKAGGSCTYIQGPPKADL